MADKIINVKIKEAYDTDANQKTKNPVLLKGQMAISSDKRKAKVGDGTSTQQNLSYMNAQHSESATKATQDASGNVITSTYATKTELDNKADKNHTHDDRYYTESEMNTKLATKAEKSHTHDDRYYTESEINSKLNDIQVGGRNLQKNSKSEKSSADYNVTNIYYADNIISGEKYTVSLQAKVSTVNNNCKLGVWMNGENNNVGYFPNLTTDYKKYSFTFTSPINASTSQYSGLYFYPDSSRNGVRVYVKELKLEKGTKVTDQSPAFEEYYTKNEIDEKNSKTASVKILASKQSSSAPYTQTVTVNGITSSSLPIPMLDTRNCTDVNNEKTVKREYGYLTYFETSTNQIKIYAKFQKPTVDLTVVFKGV